MSESEAKYVWEKQKASEERLVRWYPSLELRCSGRLPRTLRNTSSGPTERNTHTRAHARTSIYYSVVQNTSHSLSTSFCPKHFLLQFSCTLPPSDLLSSLSWYRSLSLSESLSAAAPLPISIYYASIHIASAGVCVCLSVLRSVRECVCASAFVCHSVASLHVFTDACDSWRQMCECEVINIIKLTAQHFAQFTQAMKTKAKQTQPLIFISWGWAY